MVDAINANLPILLALLGTILVPALLVWVWVLQKRRSAKKRADEMKRGNQIYKEWRRTRQ